MRHQHLNFAPGFHVAIGNGRSQAAAMVLAPGESTGDDDNQHALSDQWLFVVAGRGQARVDGRDIRLSPGDLLLIEHRERHEIRSDGDEPLQTLNFYSPPAYTGAGEELPAGSPALAEETRRRR